jgi:SpoVK/Ycf46/Vps4 family AAA+-type ATPase
MEEITLGKTLSAKKEYADAVKHYEIGLQLLRRQVDRIPPGEEKNQIQVLIDELVEEFKQVVEKANSMAEVCAIEESDFLVKPEEIEWDDVVGCEAIKSDLRVISELIRTQPQLWTNTTHPMGREFLLYGAPGTGKTRLAHALAHTSRMPLLVARPSNLMQKYVGESEKSIFGIFELARKNEPCIVFIDEVDSMGKTRTDSTTDVSLRAITEFLTAISGIGTARVFTIAATNHIEMLDDALTRRFGIPYKFDLPTREQRCILIKKKMPTFTDTMIERIADVSEGKSFSFLVDLMKRATTFALKRVICAKYFYIHDDMYYACSHTEQGGDYSLLSMTYRDVPEDKLAILVPLECDMEQVLSLM